MNYYEGQLNKLKIDSVQNIGIKLVDCEANYTNWMNLNRESISILKEFLNKIEKDLPQED